MSTSEVEAAVQELLESLGDDQGAVAKTLRKAGCRGRRSAAEVCPVATYLYREMPGTEFVVGTAAVFVRTEELEEFTLQLPPGVASFVDAFDDGEYAELEAERAS